MRETDIAWFSGLFEGEGCFSIEKNGGVKLTIGMTDLDIIERVNALFPKHQNMQPIQPKPAKAGYGIPKIRHTWRVSDPAEVQRITELMLPWLGERRAAAARGVLAHLATRPGMGGYQRAKTHCPKEHEYTPENTIYRGGAKRYRVCKTCAQVWWTTQNAKVRARRQVISA